jgi:hypothetical protein
MLSRDCLRCKNEAKYGYYRLLKRIICNCEKQFVNAKRGDKIFCRIDGSILYVDTDERDC